MQYRHPPSFADKHDALEEVNYAVIDAARTLEYALSLTEHFDLVNANTQIEPIWKRLDQMILNS